MDGNLPIAQVYNSDDYQRVASILVTRFRHSGLNNGL